MRFTIQVAMPMTELLMRAWTGGDKVGAVENYVEILWSRS